MSDRTEKLVAQLQEMIKRKRKSDRREARKHKIAVATGARPKDNASQPPPVITSEPVSQNTFIEKQDSIPHQSGFQARAQVKLDTNGFPTVVVNYLKDKAAGVIRGRNGFAAETDTPADVLAVLLQKGTSPLINNRSM